MTEQVLHLDLLALAAGTSSEAVEDLIGAAGGLASLPGVERVGVIHSDGGSDFDVAFLFILPGFAALEPFGTATGYSRFLQTKVAPLLRGLSGADVRLEDEFPAISSYGACLALAAPPRTYDWEVTAALQGWLQKQAVAGVTGLAVGEHGRYRGVAIAFGDEPLAVAPLEQAPFGPSLITGPSRGLT